MTTILAQTNKSSEQLLAEAAKAISASNLNYAKTILQKVLITDPRNTAAHTLVAAIADRENNLPLAEKHFAVAARLLPTSPETRNNYGVILLKSNRKIEAAREFTASLQLNPNQSSALSNLANIRFEEGNLKSARDLFEKSKTIAPDPEVLRALLLISLQLKEKERAAQDFNEYFRTLKSSSNTEPQSQTALGAALLKSGLLTEAKQYLEFVVASDANNIDALILLSGVFLEQKNIVAAGRILESAVARGLDDAKIYLALSEVYERGGYVENAIPAMRLAIEKDPKNDFYLARYGLLLIDAKAPVAAIIRLKEGLTQMPNSARLWLVLGIAQFTEGENPSDAQASFEKAVKFDPRSVQALAYLGTIYTDVAKYVEAANIYKRALTIEETNSLLHYLLADTLLRIPGSDEAIIEKHLRRAVELDSTLAMPHFALGKFYARGERWAEAAEEFKQAVTFKPDLAEAHYQLGRSLVRLKRLEESKPEFELYKKLSGTQLAQKETDRRELVKRLANVRF